ncbi:MAG: alpha/beta hydrolase [Acidobacteriaceae bacterium]|nr:alpha/beta hydrolase [Acidobacteriaceae bacterium]
MASWQAYAAAWLLKRRLKPRLRVARDVNELRRLFAPRRHRVPRCIEIRPDQVGGVRGEWVTTEASGPSAATLLYLHGGGYFACSAETHRPITCSFAQLGFKVFAADYRLAPEHVFPAAVEDAVAVFRGLAEMDPNMVVAGDSAGGGLAVAMMVGLRDAGFRLPAAAALFSPWVDLAARGESLRTNNKKCAMFDGTKIGPSARRYLKGADPKTPLASPLYAELASLPPLLIHVGKNETLLDDSVRLAERAERASVLVTLKVWPVVPHAWQLAPQFIPEAHQSLREAGAFLFAAPQEWETGAHVGAV